MHRKQNSVNALGIRKKLGITMHFSEIIKLQFGRNTILHVLKLCIFISNKCIITPIFCLDLDTLYTVYSV